MDNVKDGERGDPHNWNSLSNYTFLHEKHLEEHPLVLVEDSQLTFKIEPQPQALYDLIVVEGLLVLVNGIHLQVYKSGAIDRSPSQRVRMTVYSYNAHFPGGHNVLRYDNMHLSEPDVYHRHVFDPATGVETVRENLTRAQFPVMHEVLDELMRMFPPTR